MEIYLHDIDKNNFFHEDIVVMAYSQFGINELFARGFTMQMIRNYPNIQDRQNALLEYEFPTEINEQIINVQTFTPMIFVPGFETKNRDKIYQMEPNYSASELVNDFRGLFGSNIKITRMTIISTFEKASQSVNRDSEVFEFFRHIRNAAAHHGIFKLTNAVLDRNTGELQKKAKWDSFEITSKNQGQKLLPDSKDDKSAFWNQGDFVEFLLDFENHHPEIKNKSTK